MDKHLFHTDVVLPGQEKVFMCAMSILIMYCVGPLKPHTRPQTDVEITFAGFMDFPCSGIDRRVNKPAG